jgi:hypothetical protein
MLLPTNTGFTARPYVWTCKVYHAEMQGDLQPGFAQRRMKRAPRQAQLPTCVPLMNLLPADGSLRRRR